MKNMKLSIRFCTIFIVIALMPLIILNTLDILTAKEMMQKMQMSIIEEKLTGDVHSIAVYINNEVGEVSLSEGELVGEDGKKLSEETALIDQISSDLGIVATVFVKDDKGYCRTLTSIVDQKSNQRIVGTYLDQDSEAFRTVASGKEYIGMADIQGGSYTTVYQPINDASGNNIGILFAGVSLEKSNQLLSEEVGKIISKTLIILIILAIIGMIFMYYASHSITKPMLKISQEANRIAGLDLTMTIDKSLVDRGDEIGTLAQSMDSILRSLKEVIHTSDQIATKVTRTSEELANTCGETSHTTEEMAKTIQEIAQGATDQAQNTAVCMQKLEGFGTMVDEEQNNVGILNDASKKVSVLTDEGRKILEELVDKISRSNEATIKAYEDMQQTNKSAAGISEASNVIASIAEQTNLLALNASIEAARAGEQGKGFSVVAEEIRKLAEQSAKSTKMIDDQIATLQRDVSSAVDVTEKVKNMLNEQNKDVKITESKYLDIASAVEVMKQSVEQLSITGKKMIVEKDEVSSNIESLSAVAQENAAATEETSACIEEQSAALMHMHSSSETMAEMATELQDVLMKFKL